MIKPFSIVLVFLMIAGTGGRGFAQSGASAAASTKPVAFPSVRSGAMKGRQPPEKLVMEIGGQKTLVLQASGYSWGQAVWGEPILIGADGTRTKLTDLKPASAEVGWGEFSINHGPDGQPLNVGGRQFGHGLFAHANSEIIYDLDGKYARFETWIGINHTADNRGNVVFEVSCQRDQAWLRIVDQLQRGFTRDCLASLRRTVTAAKNAGLEQRLAAYEKDFDILRQGLDDNQEAVHDRLVAFGELVREIRLLQLNTPLLFVKRHAYFSPHIYDDHLSWYPGGGIYILENPAAPIDQQVVRPIVDPQTRESLGEGVYRDPDLSFDGKEMLFAFKGMHLGDTSIYRIGIDGTGLRQVLKPPADGVCREKPAGLYGTGVHDYSPCHLPDGRIAFVSTRTAGLVMCFNNHIATLHTMNADGSDMKPISVNNQTEFDPTVLPDGRLLFGRWEYVDKTALYMQSLWTVHPDGTNETALFKNNLVKPTAVLDARPVPGTDLIVASLTPHNGQSVGAIAMLNAKLGKNNLAALSNFTPEYPTAMDQGVTRGPSDPWPLDQDTVLIANNAPSHGTHSVIELIDRFGFRFVIHREPNIGCFSPMPVKPVATPPALPSHLVKGAPGKFFINDIYQGLDGIKPGTVKQLRVLETTARISGVPPGGRWWNQAFLVSWQGSYDVKNVLGVVPVEADGSAYFEAPGGKALYFQALDQDGRLVQSMRTFVQSAPGTTRSCQGCHIREDNLAPVASGKRPLAMRRDPAKITPEAWGSGLLAYPTKVQPVLDRHCVSCHGGAKGMAGGIDLSGGWTWAFNISYETLIKNTQTGFLNCNNGSVRTAEILPPRTHGSGAAPLAELLISGHKGRLGKMPRHEIDLLLAWMDINCNYYGSWDHAGDATCKAILPLRNQLLAEMDKAGCLRCHQKEIGNDWINLQTPEQSRILRAPLARNRTGLGLAWCRDRQAQPLHFRLVDQSLQPPDVFRTSRDVPINPEGKPVTPFADTNQPGYQAMLAIIRQGQAEALKSPRVDMPGANIIPGRFRELPPLSPPENGSLK